MMEAESKGKKINKVTSGYTLAFLISFHLCVSTISVSSS